MEKKSSLDGIVKYAITGGMSEQNLEDLKNVLDYKPDKELLGAEISDITEISEKLSNLQTNLSEKYKIVCNNYNKLLRGVDILLWQRKNYQEELKSCQKEKEKLAKENTLLKNKINELYQKNENLVKERTKLTNEMKKQTNKCKELENKNASLNKELDRFENDMQDVGLYISVLENKRSLKNKGSNVEGWKSYSIFECVNGNIPQMDQNFEAEKKK